MKHFGNVCNIDGKSVDPVDIITFGAPCQDLSVAGKRSGLKHAALGDDETTRSGLFFEAIRIIKEMREATNGTHPRFAIYENVPGAFSSNKGHDFHAVLEALCSVCDGAVSIPEPYDTKRPDKLIWLGAGEIVGDNYSIAWRTLDAQYWGVPQRRKRIYLVADFTGRCAGEILFKPDCLRGYMQTGNETGQSASSDAVGGVDGSVGVEYCCSMITGQQLYAWEDMANPLKARDYKDPAIVAYSFDSLSSNSMKSSNPLSGCRAVDVAKCIDTTYPDPSKNQGGVAVVQPLCLKERAGCDGGGKGALWSDKAFTLATNQDMSVIAIQANGIDRADTAGCNGAGWRENESYTLNTVDRHAVCYDARNHNAQDISGTIQAKSNGGQSLNYINPVCYTNASHGQFVKGCGALRASGGDCGGGSENVVCYDARGNGDGETILFEPRSPDGEPRIYDDICPTPNTAQGGQRQPCIAQEVYTMQRSDEYQVCDVASTQSARQYKSATDSIVEKKRRYIIRRLTPTECARLQGFPDQWGELAPYNPADAEFWKNVRKTHAEINGRAYKPVKDIKKWYNKLHTDSAEYKAYGNGLALPNAEYVLHSIAEQGAKTLGSLFDGIGGFPLAGAMNGIEPVWASEVEPYPIAVTKSRFKEVHNA